MESVILPRQMELILMMSTFTMVVEAVMARPQFLQVTQPSLAVVARAPQVCASVSVGSSAVMSVGIPLAARLASSPATNASPAPVVSTLATGRALKWVNFC